MRGEGIVVTREIFWNYTLDSASLGLWKKKFWWWTSWWVTSCISLEVSEDVWLERCNLASVLLKLAVEIVGGIEFTKGECFEPEVRLQVEQERCQPPGGVLLLLLHSYVPGCSMADITKWSITPLPSLWDRPHQESTKAEAKCASQIIGFQT